MTRHIDFRYDAEHDVVIATPHWHLRTKEDVALWYSQYRSYFKCFGRKMDSIVVLDDFEIDTAIGSHWGAERARLLTELTRLNFRVNLRKMVRLFVNTSSARYNVSTFEAETVDAAISGILAARTAAGLGRTKPDDRLSSSRPSERPEPLGRPDLRK